MLLEQQRDLLDQKLHLLRRLEAGLAWSFERLPELTEENILDPGISERVSAIVYRFSKLQDQLAGTTHHAHTMLGDWFRVEPWLNR